MLELRGRDDEPEHELGRKQLWFVIPILVIGFSPFLRMTFFKPDLNEDLSISNVESRAVGDRLEIVGVITNSSVRSWSGLNVEAEFFNAEGDFVDEESMYLRSDVGPHAKGNFKVTIKYPPPTALRGELEPKVKVSGDHTSLL